MGLVLPTIVTPVVGQRGADYSDVILADSPIVYHKFDEPSGATIVDSSGNGHDGTYTTSPVLGQSPLVTDGGKSVQFVGADLITLEAGLWNDHFVGNSNITVEMWLHPTVSVTGGLLLTAGSNIQYKFAINNVWNASCLLWTPSLQFLDSAAGTILVNTTYHYVFTYDGSNFNIWLNGTKVAGPKAVTGNMVTNGTLTMTVNGPSTDPFIDNFAMYTTTLSDARIIAHHAAGIA